MHRVEISSGPGRREKETRDTYWDRTVVLKASTGQGEYRKGTWKYWHLIRTTLDVAGKRERGTRNQISRSVRNSQNFLITDRKTTKEKRISLVFAIHVFLFVMYISIPQRNPTVKAHDELKYYN